MGHSEPGWFGTIEHYDDNGNLTGTSEPDIFGGFDHYDADRNLTGHSDLEIDGSYTNYDENGYTKGSTEPGWFGAVVHKDGDGNIKGESVPDGFLKWENKSKNDGENTSGSAANKPSPYNNNGKSDTSGCGCLIAILVFGIICIVLFFIGIFS